MKHIFAIFAFIGILLQTFNQVVIVADYYANKYFIARNLCINRDKPMLHCEGKCCLKKKLAKEGKEQAPNSQNQKSKQITLFYSIPENEISYTIFFSAEPEFHRYNDLKTISFHLAVFHPPGSFCYC